MQLGAKEGHRVGARREAENGVVRGHAVPVSHWKELHHILLSGKRKGELTLSVVATFRSVDQTELPDKLTSFQAKAIERAAGDQIFDLFLLELGALEEIEQGTIGAIALPL